MEYRFNAEEWAKLPTEQRVLRCRIMAAEARKLAMQAPSPLSKNYQTIAADWEKLASEIERTARL